MNGDQVDVLKRVVSGTSCIEQRKEGDVPGLWLTVSIIYGDNRAKVYKYNPLSEREYTRTN